MSDKEKYPNWASFGTAPECSQPKQRQEIAPVNANTIHVETGMKETDELDTYIWNLTESVSVGEKVFTVEYTEADPPELVRQALTRRDIEVAKEVFRLPAAERFKLTGERDVMSALIEFARSQAVDHNDLHSVWSALVIMARTPEKFAPLLGITEDGTSVKFDNGKSVPGLFTKSRLKGRLERQAKARKGSQKPVAAR